MVVLYVAGANLMHKREEEGCCFSGTGLSTANHVFTFNNGRNGLFLNRGRVFETDGFKAG